jgi:hypothetical protein
MDVDPAFESRSVEDEDSEGSQSGDSIEDDLFDDDILIDWHYLKDSKRLKIVHIQSVLDDHFSRAAQLFVATEVRDALSVYHRHSRLVYGSRTHENKKDFG